MQREGTYQQQHDRSDELFKQFQAEMLHKDRLRRGIDMAKIVEQKFTEKLGLLRRESEEAQSKVEMLKLQVEYVAKAERHATCRAIKLKPDLKRKSAWMDELGKLNDTMRQNPLESALNAARQQYNSFRAEMANSPWLPEKRAMQEKLRNCQQESARVREKIATFEAQIARTNEQLNLHGKWPFETFCVNLANYRQKHSKMSQMMIKEQANFKKLKEKADKLKLQEDEMESKSSDGIMVANEENGSQVVAQEENEEVAVVHQQHEQEDELAMEANENGNQAVAQEDDEDVVAVHQQHEQEDELTMVANEDGNQVVAQEDDDGGGGGSDQHFLDLFGGAPTASAVNNSFNLHTSFGFGTTQSGQGTSGANDFNLNAFLNGAGSGKTGGDNNSFQFDFNF